MRTITVAARKRDPQAYGVQKYSNTALWNTPGGKAPNGVSATRYLRDTAPDVSALSPLAGWLVKNAPQYCAGKMPSLVKESRVVCYNGRMTAEEIILKAKHLTGTYTCSTPEHAGRAERIGKLFFTGRLAPQQIDWLFGIIEPKQSDEDYWNLQAERILSAGTVRIVIGDIEWNINSGKFVCRPPPES